MPVTRCSILDARLRPDIPKQTPWQINYRASCIVHRVSYINYRESSIKHRVSDQIWDKGTYRPAVVSDSEHGIG
jgi:hypothetical protein